MGSKSGAHFKVGDEKKAQELHRDVEHSTNLSVFSGIRCSVLQES